FHIGGSDASGIVYKVGKDVTNVKVGDEVVVHCGTWSRDCPWVRAGNDPMYSPSFRIWGYETNWGSFAQFTKVQAHQCLPRPQHLSWASSASYMLVGATAYRMLMGWGQHAVRPDDVVLCWGGAGGLGSMAIQIVRAMGGTPVAVVSSPEKFEYCEKLGAKGCINRKDFDHWGMLPHWKDEVGYAKWLKGARAFGKAIWEVLGERKNPRVVFEHPGESTIPTSIFVCNTGGLVVICAGTTGYNATVDLRYLWMRQKRLQGSHFANDEQSTALNELVLAKQVDPCTSRVFDWNDLAESHQLMHENKHPHGNMSVLVGAHAVETSATPTLTSDEPEETYRPPKPEPGQVAILESGRRVREVMQEGVVSCSPDANVEQVAQLLVNEGIHAVVVVKGNAALGVVSQTDVVLAQQGRDPEQMRSITAGAIMTPEVIGCEPESRLSDAITLMTRQRIHRLFVVDKREGRRVIGVLSLTDVIRTLAQSKEG
ncbi:MAG: crotonyl-CoA carboxylase/reductase, partial [Deltaproteobacteria bacterium]|nr:crotonyl-CoA carboxylase/reductase [Deltaproteobacteria bacterium]